jgi:SMODS-associating 2TM, beta-strand rich effector domain
LSTFTNEIPAQPDESSAQPPTQGWHLYSASDVKRIVVIHVLGVITAAAATGIALLTHLSDWIGVGIAAALLWFIFAVFEKHAWHWCVMALVPHSTVPNLSGRWRGHILITKGKEGEKSVNDPLGCWVTIRQDWSRIAIDFGTDVSSSWSVMASINARKASDDVVYYELHYEYYVIPKPDAPRELAEKVGLVEPHYGTAHLKFQPGPRLRIRSTGLSGIWFNDQHFQRWGDIMLTRDP